MVRVTDINARAQTCEIHFFVPRMRNWYSRAAAGILIAAMELREFAEQVLFATTLEEKLRAPDIITDEHPGAPLLEVENPGRPAGLQFKAQGSGKADFPGVQRLE